MYKNEIVRFRILKNFQLNRFTEVKNLKLLRYRLDFVYLIRIKNLAIPKRRYAPPEFDIFTATWYTRPPARRSVFTCNAIQDLELLAWPKSLRPALVNDQASSWGEPLGLTSENVSHAIS